MSRGESGRQRDRESQKALCCQHRLPPNTYTSAGVEFMNCETVTWAGIKSGTLNPLNHPGAPKHILNTRSWHTLYIILRQENTFHLLEDVVSHIWQVVWIILLWVRKWVTVGYVIYHISKHTAKISAFLAEFPDLCSLGMPYQLNCNITTVLNNPSA